MHVGRDYRLIVLIFSLFWIQIARGEDNPNRCTESLNAEKTPSHRIQFQNAFIYVPGKSLKGRLLRLSEKKYREVASSGVVDPDTILLMERIPLDVDLPLVAGVIVSQPLTMEGTHVQDVAEKLNIPFVMIPHAYKEPHLWEMARDPGFRILTVTKNLAEIRDFDPQVDIEKSRKKSVLPQPVDKGFVGIVDESSAGVVSRVEIGEKFSSLVEVQRTLPGSTPSLAALTAGYYERFLDVAKYQGESLRNFILRKQLEIQNADDDVLVRKCLEEMREAIVGAFAPYLFEKILTELLSRFGPTKVMVRSNNSEEDWLGSGLYESVLVDLNSADSLELGIRKVWASLYSNRAFSIRQRWGFSDEFLSMPLLIHPYVDNELLHAVARVKFSGSQMVMEINGTLGKDSRATNPHLNSRTLSAKILRKNSHVVIQRLRTSGKSEIVSSDLIDFYQWIEPVIQRSFLDRRYPPDHVDLEVVFLEPFRKGENLVPILLQYKNVLGRETVNEVISGKIPRTELDSYHPREILSEDVGIDEVRKQFHLEPLSHLGTDMKMVGSRYALIELRGGYHIVFWSDTRHIILKSQLMAHDPAIRWIRSGTLKYGRDGVMFSRTTNAGYVDGSFPEKFLEEAFVRAFFEENQRDPEFLKNLNSRHAVIEFNSGNREYSYDTIDWVRGTKGGR